MNISEELFNNVFEGCVFNYIKADVIHYSQPCDIMEGSWVESETNINDFFFKCKEWAASKGFELFSTRLRDKKRIAYNCSLYGYYGDEEDFNSTSEQQAVFDACQWILKNMDKTC